IAKQNALLDTPVTDFELSVRARNCLRKMQIRTLGGGTTLDDDDDMFREMRLALRLHRTPSVDGPAPGIADVFRMATENGARICRRGDEIGRLATGMAADFIAVDLDRLSWPWVAPDVDVRHLIVQRAQARDVVLTVVAGRVVWQEGSSPLVDVGDLGARAAEALAQAPANEPPHALIEAVRGYYRRWA
ncbi:MAG: amidohydrolase family protein, partial [Kamptonema sp. SIO1D9]|nr:amidohydrolase family protein [Kamptonema sp. SIO1D9]